MISSELMQRLALLKELDKQKYKIINVNAQKKTIVESQKDHHRTKNLKFPVKKKRKYSKRSGKQRMINAHKKLCYDAKRQN